MQSQLLHNAWFGKAVGACCAWIWAPAEPLHLAIAIIGGIALGHLYDLWASVHVDQDQSTLSQLANQHTKQHTQETSPHLAFLFAACGRIAKAGGPVTPQHIAYAQQVMRNIGLDKDGQAQAQNWFAQGKQEQFPFEQSSRDCLGHTDDGGASRLTLLRCMCAMATISANDESLASLRSLGGYLGFTPARVAKEFGEIRDESVQPQTQSRFKPSSKRIIQTPSAEYALSKAYKQLGVPKGASTEQAKKAYRRLINRYHPDKLPPNATDLDQRRAANKMIELREALDLIAAQQEAG